MSTPLTPYTSFIPTARTSRALTRISNDTIVSTTVVHAKAEVEAAKVDGVSAVTAKALQDVALLSQMEQSLAQTVPHASGRLAMASKPHMRYLDPMVTALRSPEDSRPP